MTSVGKAIPHDNATGHVTGQAWYIDDMRSRTDELVVGFFGSPVSCGAIRSLQIEGALSIAGVVGVYTAKDIPGHNSFGPIIADEPFLAEDRVEYREQPIAVIAAETKEALKKAIQSITVQIEEDEPIYTIDEARKREAHLGPRRRIACGNFEGAYEKAPMTLEGLFVNGGQEQFYLESQACLAYPDEDRQIKVLSSTQNPTETQAVVAEVLGLGMHEVVCECKRMGGGFGGKETQSALPAMMVALTAMKTKRSARIVYTKDIDMKATGKRHPYHSYYKVGFDGEGRIHALEFDFYSNGGAYIDLSGSILERTQLHAENGYYIANMSINAQVCRTNLPPNTAFRGFGGPQGMVAMENVIEEVARATGLDPLTIRKKNCYGIRERNVTPYGQIVESNVLPQIFEKLEATSDYQQRRVAVDRFNETSKTHLKGLAFTPIKFGISFTAAFLNQGNALVNVYTDGTIQVSTGATEMGQGVNTKIRQLVADEFGVSIDSVIVMKTSTEKNNNTSPTAASASTDLNGNAAVIACQKIRSRIAAFMANHFASEELGLEASAEEIRFEDGVVFDRRAPETMRMPFGACCDLARRHRVNLGERGFYKTPGVSFNRETGKGNPFFYFTCGGAVAEVTIDRFTGDLTVDRVDLLMDIGNMLNPGVDRGQILGGFVQGQGWATTENLTWSEDGSLLSHSPTTYKIPGADDVPKVFNLDFIDNPGHKKNIRRSKAVGEPPLMLAISVWAAAKNAMNALSTPQQANDLSLPATGEELLRVMTSLKRRSSPASKTPTVV